VIDKNKIMHNAIKGLLKDIAKLKHDIGNIEYGLNLLNTALTIKSKKTSKK